MRRSLILLAISLLAPALAQASPLLDGQTYQLNNHPDGNQAPPAYGLRLDGLLGDSSEEWTFDFEAAGSNMRLVWSDAADTINISGVAFGGEDVGNAYDPTSTAFWRIDFEYSNVIDNGGSLDVLAAGGPNGAGTLSRCDDVTCATTNLDFALRDFGDPDTFHIDSNHRGFPGLSGWGWLNHAPINDSDQLKYHEYSSDWLFTIGNPVPEPSAALVFGIGLSVMAIGRRRP